MVLFLMAAMLIVNAVVFLLQCIPLARVWDPTIDGSCINLAALLYGMSKVS